MSLGSIQVKSGQVVSGRYRRANYNEAVEVSVEVARSIAYRNGTLLIGTSLVGEGRGKIVGVYAGCFDPRNVKVEDGSGEPADLRGFYIGADYQTFGFIKHVPDTDFEWIEIAGGKPVLDIEHIEEVHIATVA